MATTIYRLNDLSPCKYRVLPSTMLQDETISPECRILISHYLIETCDSGGFPKDEAFSISIVPDHLKNYISKKKWLKIFSEAVEAGYIKMEIIEENVEKNVTYYISDCAQFSSEAV